MEIFIVSYLFIIHQCSFLAFFSDLRRCIRSKALFFVSLVSPGVMVKAVIATTTFLQPKLSSSLGTSHTVRLRAKAPVWKGVKKLRLWSPRHWRKHLVPPFMTNSFWNLQGNWKDAAPSFDSTCKMGFPMLFTFLAQVVRYEALFTGNTNCSRMFSTGTRQPCTLTLDPMSQTAAAHRIVGAM